MLEEVDVSLESNRSGQFSIPKVTLQKAQLRLKVQGGIFAEESRGQAEGMGVKTCELPTRRWHLIER